ncbi:MAG: 2-amino-4-hydroxy-6-hydroxymethyldihydropteridine diphosphokinase [Candidatus Dormibacteraceae bacterium]
MDVCALALGSNLGDRRAALHGAVAGLRAAGFQVHASALYETPPWGDRDQPDYLNAAVVVQSARAEDWLGWARRLEGAAGRVRDPDRRFGPRTLDVDVIEIWRDGRPLTQDDGELTLPHPRARERPFVLVPLAEVAPDRELGALGHLRDLARAVRRRPGDLRLVAEDW